MTLAALLALFSSAILVLRRRFRLRADETFLFGCLLAFLEIVVIVQALGLASRLQPWPARLATAGCIAANLAAGFWRRPSRPFKVKRKWPVPGPLWPALIGVLTTALLRLFIAWKVPPEGWDGLGYHLPIVVSWLQRGNFDLRGLVGPQPYFAWNGELAATWLALLNGNLDWAKLVQVLSLPVLAAAGAVLGRRLAGLRWAWPCAVALPAIPVVLIQAGLPYVDALYASFWLAAIAAALGLAVSGRNIYLWAFAVALGLSLGTKSTFFFLVPPALLLIAALKKSPLRPRLTLGRSAVCLALVALAGAGAYIRNLVLTGNPMFPFGLSIAGAPIFKGIVSLSEMPAGIERWFVPSSWAWIVYPFWETVRGTVGYTHLNGFGPLFALGWLLLPMAFWQAWKRREGMTLAFLGLIPLVLLLFFTMQPVRIPRYIIFLAPLPILGLAYTFRRAQGILRTAALTAWTLAILGGCSGVLAYMYSSPGIRGAWSSIRAVKPVNAWDYYQRQYSSLGRAWRALDQRLAAGDVVAVNYGELLLPWYGMPPRARVQVVVFGTCVYPHVPKAATAEEWIDEVDRLAARFVVVWSPAWNPGRETLLCQALQRNSGRFKQAGRWESPNFGWVEIYEAARNSF